MNMRIVDSSGHVYSELTSLPGCSQVVVSHAAFCNMPGQGFGSTANQERIELCDKLGYDYMLCTVVSTNIPQKKLLATNGWRKLDHFTSSKTANVVELWRYEMLR